jgi:hypothetical protein
MSRNLSVALICISWMLGLSSSSDAKDLGCQNNVCLQYRGERGQFYVYLSAKIETTHYNLRSPCVAKGKQVEVSKEGTHEIDFATRCQVSVQSCKRSDIPFLGTTRSKCTPWASWLLTGPIGVSPVQNKRYCRGGFCADITLQTRPKDPLGRNTDVIYVTLVSWPRSTYRNIRCFNGEQREHKESRWDVCSGTFVSVQACNRKAFSTSACTKWVQLPPEEN